MQPRNISACLASLFLACCAADTPRVTAPVEHPLQASHADEGQRAIEALEHEYNTAQQTFFDELDKAQTDAELEQTVGPDTAAFAKRFHQIADEYPKTNAAARALVWIFVHEGHQSFFEQEESRLALERLLSDHLNEEVVGDVCKKLSFDLEPHADAALALIAKNAAHSYVRIWASYCRGYRCLEIAASNRRLRHDEMEPERLAAWPIAWRAWFDGLDSVTLEAQGSALLEGVIRDGSEIQKDNRRVSDMARGALFELRDLAIGKAVPDIEGEDIAGVKFKLSDYRGKVVLLDFWGFW